MDTLRSLVSLHHASSGFMRDPAEIPTAFKRSFNAYKTDFITYPQFAARAQNLLAERPENGLEKLSEVATGGMSRGVLGDYYSAPGVSASYSRNIFTLPRPWTGHRETSSSAEISERELLVREALMGTWEHGADDRPRPSLDGVVDILQARGTSLESAAQEWKGDRDAEESTEDGM